MTTILTVFFISIFLAQITTPAARYLGNKFGAIDKPDERKVHQKIIPRSGGIAIVFTFFSTLFISSFFYTNITNNLVLDKIFISYILGAIFIYGIGQLDDFYNLGPKIKLIFQIIGATIAYSGGLRIDFFQLDTIHFNIGVMSYFITIFWFIFIINAINLIDGLDGLASGIIFFACIVLVFLSVLRNDYLIAMLFAALGGTTLGFLRYNFFPATIFMGDGGSYFLGYTIAAFSIMGSAKSQVGAALLIPLVALGVPIFDTLIAPLRRFIEGKALFKPDRNHIHHRLIDMGLSTKNAVLIIYGTSIVLCFLSILLVNFRSEQAGLFLILFGSCSFFIIRKIGYFEYFAANKIYGWFRDVTDEAGFTRDRRTFLSLQMEINKSKNIEELWNNISNALNKLEIDMAELNFNIKNNLKNDNKNRHLSWMRNNFSRDESICGDCNLKIELPLLNDKGYNFGTLWIIKDLKKGYITHYTLRRIEHLRRTISSAMEKILT